MVIKKVMILQSEGGVWMIQVGAKQSKKQHDLIKGAGGG